MPRSKRRRSYTKRRDSIWGDLRRTIARTYSCDLTRISDSTTLGPEYLAIINEVAQMQGRPALKNHVSMSPDSTFAEALTFLLSAIQT